LPELRPGRDDCQLRCQNSRFPTNPVIGVSNVPRGTYERAQRGALTNALVLLLGYEFEAGETNARLGLNT